MRCCDGEGNTTILGAPANSAFRHLSTAFPLALGFNDATYLTLYKQRLALHANVVLEFESETGCDHRKRLQRTFVRPKTWKLKRLSNSVRLERWAENSYSTEYQR